MNDDDVLHVNQQDRSRCRGRDVQRLLFHNRQPHTIADLDRDQCFSWTRCIISLVSYALLLSDVLRTGLGIREPLRSLVSLEPDSKVFVGPTAYLVNHLTTSNATTEASGVGVWPYKYDTTSIGMRALAEYFSLQAWPKCVLYKGHCDESSGLSPLSVFEMIDSLVEAVSGHADVRASQTRNSTSRSFSTGRIAVRTENIFRDRLHHFALPWFFQQTIKRTNQAIYREYSAKANFSETLCGSLLTSSPFSCLENWTRSLPGKCSTTRTLCDGYPRVWDYIPTRQKLLAAMYPGHVIDFVILEGMEDYTRAAVTYQGRRFYEVVLLSRARWCQDRVCRTVAVDDYRYEASGFVMNADSWFPVVATLRVVGQVYTWLRVLLIVLVCHLRQRRSGKGYRQAPVLAHLHSIARTVFLVPSQVIIYGSMFPIFLYAVAHLLDSPAIYETVSIRYNSLLGEVAWNASDFISHCAVSMRTVWVLSLMCHIVLSLYTKCVWSPTSGIPGVPELFISFVASITIFAQYRSVMLRNTEVLQVEEVIPSHRTYLLRSDARGAPRSLITQLFFGSPIDHQCILSALIGLLCVSLVLKALKRLMPGFSIIQLTLVSRTFGPYSAGSLWPRHRLVVSWPEFNYASASALGPGTGVQRRGGTLAHIGVRTNKQHGAPDPPALDRPLSMNSPTLVRHYTQSSKTASLRIRQEMQSIGARTRQFESAAYLINLAVMTDPITMAQLRFFRGRNVGVYESKMTRQCVLVPYDLRASSADVAIIDDLILVVVVNTKDLEWDDLLRCG